MTVEASLILYSAAPFVPMTCWFLACLAKHWLLLIPLGYRRCKSLLAKIPFLVLCSSVQNDPLLRPIALPLTLPAALHGALAEQCQAFPEQGPSQGSPRAPPVGGWMLSSWYGPAASSKEHLLGLQDHARSIRRETSTMGQALLLEQLCPQSS